MKNIKKIFPFISMFVRVEKLRMKNKDIKLEMKEKCKSFNSIEKIYMVTFQKC